MFKLKAFKLWCWCTSSQERHHASCLGKLWGEFAPRSWAQCLDLHLFLPAPVDLAACVQGQLSCGAVENIQMVRAMRSLVWGLSKLQGGKTEKTGQEMVVGSANTYRPVASPCCEHKVTEPLFWFWQPGWCSMDCTQITWFCFTVLKISIHSSLIQLTQTVLLDIFPLWSIIFNDQLMMILWIFLHDLVHLLMERGLSWNAVPCACLSPRHHM